MGKLIKKEPQPPHIKCPLNGKMCECLKEEIQECISIKNGEL